MAVDSGKSTSRASIKFSPKMTGLINEMYGQNISIIRYSMESGKKINECIVIFKKIIERMENIRELLDEGKLQEVIGKDELDKLIKEGIIRKASEVVRKDKNIRTMNIKVAREIVDGTISLEDIAEGKNLEGLQNILQKRLQKSGKLIKKSKDNANEEGEMEGRIEYSRLTKLINSFNKVEGDSRTITFQEIWNTLKYQDTPVSKEKLIERLYREILTTNDENKLLTNLFSIDGNQDKAEENLYSFLNHLYISKLDETEEQTRIKKEANEKLRNGFLKRINHKRGYDGNRPYFSRTGNGKLRLMEPMEKLRG